MSKSNPFDLPPPWNPRYELPQNVDDEGLERHAYTTAWAPRGSFDDPKVGYAGYAVPEQIKEEGYGVGAMTTRWAQRGTYYGPKVKHWLDRPSAQVVGRKPLPGGATQLQIQTMAGIETAKTGAAPFTAYGMSAARALLATVKMMPPDERRRQLQRALDRIDPKLYARAEEAANKELKVGVPDEVALERGLAAAMSYGIASELVDLGKGKKPQRATQLGAVCYSALGATTPVPGECSSDGTKIFATLSDGTGYWRRKVAGDVCKIIGTVTGETTIHTGTTQPVAPPPAPSPADQKFLQIGPFLIPTMVGAWSDHRALAPDKQAYVDANIAIAAKAGGISTTEMATGKYPFVKFQMDDDGSQWGLYYQKKSDGSTILAYHKVGYDPKRIISGVTSGGIIGTLRDIASAVGGAIASVFKAIWEGIKWVAVKVVDFAKDAAAWVADKACDLLSSSIGQVGAAAAGAAAGGAGGAQAAAMGAQIAAGACASPPGAPPPITPPPETPSLMPLLLIGGAGLAAFLILGRNKS
jgi:hypothetical protein